MKRHMVFSAGIVILLSYGCAGTDALNSCVAELENRVGKIEAQKTEMPSLEAQAQKADDAAARADVSAKKAEEAEARAVATAKAASSAERKAETAEKKTVKEFERMQKNDPAYHGPRFSPGPAIFSRETTAGKPLFSALHRRADPC